MPKEVSAEVVFQGGMKFEGQSGRARAAASAAPINSTFRVLFG